MTRPANPDVACRAVRCPTCSARRGEPCHQPGDFKRIPLTLIHLSRRRLWEKCSGVQN